MKRVKYFGNIARQYEIEPKGNVVDLIVYFKQKLRSIVNLLKRFIRRFSGIKFQLSIQLNLCKYNIESDKYHSIHPWFNSRSDIAFDYHSIEKKVINSFNTCLSFFDAFVREGSGWFVRKVDKIRINIYKYSFWGGNKRKNVQILPKVLRKKKSILDIQSSGNKCFLYCVLAHIYKQGINRNRSYRYKKYIKEIDTTCITFPTKIIHITKFENKNNLTINVFGLDKCREKYQAYPIFISTNYDTTNEKKHINLLLFKDHYYLITNFHAFVRQFCSTNCKYYCYKCLIGFYIRNKFEKHIQGNCQLNYTGQNYYMPPKGTFIKYKNYEKSLYAPYTLYCDFESTISNINSEKGSNTKLVGKHLLNSFGCLLVSKYEHFCRKPKLFLGKNVIHKFLDYLFQLKEEIYQFIENDQEEINITKIDVDHLINQKKCYLCGLNFDGVLTKKYLDHSHFALTKTAREIEGSINYACNRCNLTMSAVKKSTFKINVFFHNLTSYDLAFILNGIASYRRRLEIKAIPLSSEKFKSIMFDHFVFIDSYQFLSSSLDDLSKLLYKEGEGREKFIYTQKYFNKKKFDEYIFQKGYMPYEYITNGSKLKEKNLPPRECFYNSLTCRHITEEQYDHANKMFKVFNCKTLGDYLKIYLKIDVLLLADVFEEFRKTCLEQYKLDPSHYISLSSFSYDAMLKFCNCEIECMSDISQYSFIQDMIRGGVTNVSSRWCVKEKESDRIIFLDANALYAHCLCMYLPIGGYMWLNEESCNTFDVMAISDTADIGYILEVDLLYPEMLHTLHNDFPLAPLKQNIYYNQLSDYSKNILKQLDSNFSKSEKLICTLNNKKKYVLHYVTLKLYLKLGLKLTKIHRILSFKQKPWMKPYIENNNRKRAECTSTFQSNLFKLLNNSCFGKSIENVKKRVNIQILSDPEKVEKLIKKPRFHSLNIYNDKLVGVRMLNDRILLNKAFIIGATVLDLAKAHMYDFHYNTMLKIFFPGDIKLIYTDTDSLAYKITDKQMCNKLKQNEDLFDFSNLSKTNPLFNNKNKRILGKFKLEHGDKEIEEFIALRSKMYSILFEDKTELKHLKGVKKYTTDPLTHENFRNSLIESKSYARSFYSIRTFKQNVYTCLTTKTAITPFDDKRYLLLDGVNSLAYGNKKIREMKRRKRKLSE